jgi:hypothetical protein
MFRKRDRMIQIKTDAEVALMREAGLVVGRTLEALRAAAVPGVTTADLDGCMGSSAWLPFSRRTPFISAPSPISNG